MNDLFFQLRNICNRNRDGSESTKATRANNLEMFSEQLIEMGYRHLRPSSLKQKHVQSLVDRWQAENISVKTIKNRMSHLRWWAEKPVSWKNKNLTK